MRLGLDDLIDPRLRLLADESRGFYENRPPGRGPRDFEELRAVRAGAGDPAPVDPPAVDEVVEAEGRSVPVRVHAPAGGVANGVFLEFHGGGFYMGSAAGSDVRNRRLADALGIAVVSVDYRLAPEHPWPAAPDDGETAALWLVEHAAQRFGTRKLAVGGFSAGSTLAMTTLLRLRDRGINAFDCAVLQFGTYDLSTQTPAGRLIADEYFLEAYAGTAPDRTHPDISPIYAELSGLPSVLMVVGEQDILLQDNLAMAARISAFGGNVDLRIYPEAPHGFTGHPTAMAKAALDDIETWVSGQLGARP